jgi:hypothetical protein
MFDFLKNKNQSNTNTNKQKAPTPTQTKSNTTKNGNSQSNAFKNSLKAQTYSTKQAAVNQIHRDNAGKKSSSNTDCKIRDHSHSHGRGL